MTNWPDALRLVWQCVVLGLSRHFWALMATTRANQLLQLWERHQSVRRSLKSVPKRLLDSPLSRWVLPTDRGVPIELARRSVASLLGEDFDDIVAAPGIGVAKLTTLIDLMERVGQGEPEGAKIATEWRTATGLPGKSHGSVIQSDRQWMDDVATIHSFGLEVVPLGRLAAALSELPRTMWCTPLGQFTKLSYAGLQSVPYFGKRRIETIVRVVSDTARLARAAGAGGVGGINWHAHAIQTVESWIREQFAQGATIEQPTEEELRNGFLAPFLKQMELDLGSRAVAILEHQFATFFAELSPNVSRKPRVPAAVAALSRPRLHQIKEDVRYAALVRWPDGGGLLASLADAVARRPGDGVTPRMLQALSELLYHETAAPLVRIAAFTAAESVPPSSRGLGG